MGAESDRGLERARRFARIMDGYYLDPLLGLLVPAVGDALGALFGMYLVVFAWRRGTPKVVLARMLMNLGLDAVIGAIPIIGDIGDFAFKANQKNLALIEARQESRAPTAGDWAVLLGALALFIGVIVLLVYATVRLVSCAGAALR